MAVRNRWLPTSVLAIGLTLLLLTPVSAQSPGPVTVTVNAVTISIEITDGTVDFGSVEFGTSRTTQSIPAGGPFVPGQTQSVLNNSSIPIALLGQYQELALAVYGADCNGTPATAEWTPVIFPPAPAAASTFALAAGNVNNTGIQTALPPGGFPIPLSPGELIPVAATSDLDFTIYMPISSPDTACTIPTLIIATIG